MRKINGGGTGTMSLSFRKPYGELELLILGGAIYVTENTVLRKIRPSDGAQLWEIDYDSRDPSDVGHPRKLRAGPFGQIFLFLARGDFEKWSFGSIDSDRHGLQYYSFPSLSFPTLGTFIVNPYGEVVVAGEAEDQAGTFEIRGVAYRFFHPMEILPDSYRVIEGQSLTSNGKGVLFNDRFVNPVYASAYQIIGSGPSSGQLDFHPSGEFTYVAQEANGASVPAGPQSFRYIVIRDGQAMEGVVAIDVIQGPLGLYFSKNPVPGPQTIHARVVLSSHGLPTTVGLSANSSLVSLPSSAVAPIDSQLADFDIAVLEAVTSEKPVTISATLNGMTVTGVLQIAPVRFASTTLLPSTVTGGQSATLYIRCNGVCPPGGITVQISEDSPYCSIPSSATIPPGGTTATVTVETTSPPSQKYAHITVWNSDYTSGKILTIRP